MKKKIESIVDTLMEEGKRSVTKGWTMSDILDVVESRYGEEASEIARNYIMWDICGLRG